MSWGGQLGFVGSESWSNTLRWKTVNQTPDAGILQGACDLLVPVVTNWLRSAGAQINQGALLDYVKLNWILDTGLQRDPNTVISEVLPQVGGADASACPPFYQTFALTLRTRLKRGRTHAGRIYPPLVHHAPAGAGQPYCSDAAANGMAAAFLTLIRDSRTVLGTALGGGGGSAPDPAVFSPANPAKGYVAAWAPIIGVGVDKVPDVQHRRTKSIPRNETDLALIDP
jgi:hypothetical protein